MVLDDAASTPRTRAHAVGMLGQLVPDAGADDHVWAALTDPAEEVRWAAAVLLAPSGDRRVLLVLLAGLESSDHFRRETVAAALASMTEAQRSRLASLAAGERVDLADASSRSADPAARRSSDIGRRARVRRG